MATIILLGLLLLVLVLILLYNFTPSAVRYWQYLRKVKKLPLGKYKSYLYLGINCELIFRPPNEMIEKLLKIVKRSPSMFVAWIGPIAALVIHRAKHVKIFLPSVNHTHKPFVYAFMEPWLGTGLLLSSGSKWHSRRKMLTPAFHFSILENFIQVFDEKSRILVEKLKKQVDYKKFDVSTYITMCAVDVLCETAMGVNINAQELGEKSEYVKAVCNITEEVVTRVVFPWLYPDVLYYLSPSGRRFKKYRKTLHDFSNKVIQQRRLDFSRAAKEHNFSDDYYGGKKKKMAFLDIMLEYSENGDGLTDEDIREEVDNLMFAGHDTTAAAMCWTVQMLAIHKDVQNRVQEEIESIFQGSDGPVTSKDLNQMKYLERVIKETLRLYPSVPAIGRTVNEDFEMDGHTIPAGITTAIAIYVTHRDPEHFPDPEKFNPDNFLPERVAARHPYAYIPFSAGPRNCIGQKFAMLEMKMVISYILRHYEIHATGDVPKPMPYLILKPENGVQVRITPRSVSV